VEENEPVYIELADALKDVEMSVACTSLLQLRQRSISAICELRFTTAAGVL